jgi:hypothetical protein
MMFLTQKKLDQKIRDALVQAVSIQAADMSALRDEIAQLKADAAERANELERDLVRRLTDERKLHEAEAQGLLSAVESVRQSIPDIPPLPLPDPRLRVHAQEIRELVDTVQYILDGPPPVTTTVINNYLTTPERVSWAKPMGAR